MATGLPVMGASRGGQEQGVGPGDPFLETLDGRWRLGFQILVKERQFPDLQDLQGTSHRQEFQGFP